MSFFKTIAEFFKKLFASAPKPVEPTPLPAPVPVTPKPEPTPVTPVPVTPEPQKPQQPTQPAPQPTIPSQPVPTPAPASKLVKLAFTKADWVDVYGMAQYGGARISYSPTYLEMETKAIQGKSGVDPSTGKAIGTTAILLRSDYFTKNPVKDFEATITFKNIRFTRIGDPNAWEGCLWVGFNGSTTKPKPWNYLAFKTTGLEGGTAFDEVGQKFWSTPSTMKWPLGTAFTVVIKKVGRNVSVKSNGTLAWQGQLAEGTIYDVPGTIWLYCEDAAVAISQFDVNVLA